MTVSFEVAETDDWPGIWQIIREVVRTGDTYPYPPDITEETARAIWMKGGGRELTYVARIDGEIVGTAYIRANGVGLSDHIANAGWMVDPRRQGQGIGRPFAEHVIDEARRLGYHGMQFNAVVATNTRAVGLWESLGFDIVGTVPDAFRQRSGEMVPVHIMYRRL
ncbi:MAG TPA: GNAT family N-acetyltransferase [Acidimicrobiia bacterium]|nr:GNAT family N-acetyltransferase [Acidimicrobiia bacterium]